MACILATLLALGGWIVPWQHDAGVASVTGAQGKLGDVLLFAARLDGAGHPVLDDRGDAWKDTVARVHASGGRAWLTIVNDRVQGSGAPVLKDAELVSRLLGDAVQRARHRAEIVSLAKGLGVEGVDIDYENLPVSERGAFTTFARELASDLRAAGFSLSITVQPKTSDSAARGSGAMEWARLCDIADRVQVMLYNEHNGSTEPGPIASPDWISHVIDYGLSACTVSKLVPVLKVSGMDWGPGKAEWRSFAEVASLMTARAVKPRREWFSRVPWFAYRGTDGRHVVYYEDARSLGTKADRLRARGFGAIVLWSLGSEDPEAIPRLVEILGSSGSQKR